MGKQLLLQLNIPLEQLTHRNSEHARETFEQIKEELYLQCEKYLVNSLHEKLGYIDSSLHNIDGRTIAAVFQRFDIIEKLHSAANLLEE